MKHTHVMRIILCVLLLTTIGTFAQAQEIAISKITDNISVLSGAGGNVGILTGDDGVLVIDTMIPNVYEKMKAKLTEVAGNKPVRFAVITHWHYDHIGSNVELAKTGTVIIAHENVRKRMSAEQYIEFFKSKVPPAAPQALPLITFTKEITFYLNGEEVHVFHIQPGHSDGDSVIFFKKANVIQTGDLYFTGQYPFIDTSTGGSVANMIKVNNLLLPMIDDATKIIPGHGPVSNKTQFKAYIDMLTRLQDIVSGYIKAGKTLEEVVAAKPTKEFDALYGNGFFKPDQFAALLYSDLSRKY